jgi:hypothetical protein
MAWKDSSLTHKKRLGSSMTTWSRRIYKIQDASNGKQENVRELQKLKFAWFLFLL